MTAACDRGCRASFGLLVTKEMKRKEKREQKWITDRKMYPLGMGNQGIMKEMCVGGWGGRLVSYISG